MRRIKAAVVGLGYWGPNLARNLQVSDDYELVALCDRDPARLDRVGNGFPAARRYSSVPELLKEAKAELIAIATPVAAHFEIAKAALESGSNVLCEKPLAATIAEATQLVELASRVGRSLFVDHTFTYTGAVRRIRDIYAAGKLGDLFYVDSVRINLGLFQPDVDVIWDLAPHDLSILRYVLGRSVVAVRANGSAHNPRNFVDVAYLTVEYEGGLSAHLHLSWLSPVKVRRMIFPGTTSSLIYDELEMSEKIKVYEHGVSFDVANFEQRRQVLINYRRGDMHAPAVDNKEALGVEMREIAEALRGGGPTVTTGLDGLEIVRVLDAAQRSLASGGARVIL